MTSSERERELREERDRYRRALERIADQESGGWGVIAHEALHPFKHQAKENIA